MYETRRIDTYRLWRIFVYTRRREARLRSFTIPQPGQPGTQPTHKSEPLLSPFSRTHTYSKMYWVLGIFHSLPLRRMCHCGQSRFLIFLFATDLDVFSIFVYKIIRIRFCVYECASQFYREREQPRISTSFSCS